MKHKGSDRVQGDSRLEGNSGHNFKANPQWKYPQEIPERVILEDHHEVVTVV